MKRRQFFGYAGGGLAALAVGAGVWKLSQRQAVPSLNGTRETLQSLARQTLTSSGSWTPGQIFSHLAQSIEFSLQGYPQPRSHLFQQTVGRIAFAVFAEQGSMSHPLDEAIPGAPMLSDSLETQQGLQRLFDALDAFEHFDGELKPHFAFGALSKADYTLAHILHIHDHLQQITS